ncbi:MAG: hypothetical protein Q6J44_00970 [Gloeomargarita sp. DG02_4_bins_56]
MAKNRSRFTRFPRSLWLGCLGLAWVLAGLASWRAVLNSAYGK